MSDATMLFSHLEPYAGDPIIGLNETFQKDPRPGKINLSIGIYFDDAGRIPVLGCVREAEAQMLAESAPKSYLGMEGSAPMRQAVQKLLFGAEHAALKAGRVATLQTVGFFGFPGEVVIGLGDGVGFRFVRGHVRLLSIFAVCGGWLSATH